MTEWKSIGSVSRNDTFRSEVMRARSDSWLGPMRITPPPLARAALAVSIALLVAMIAIVSLGAYTRYARAEGSIISSAGVVAISSAADGTISKIYVQNGQHVRKGQILFELSGEATNLDGGDTHASRVAILRTKQATVRADLAALAATRAYSLGDLRAQIASRDQQMVGLSDQILIQSKRTEAAQQLYEQWVGLAGKGFVSKAQILQQRDVVLQGKANASQLKGQRSKLGEDLATSRSALARLDDDVAGSKRKLERDLADVDADLATAELEVGSAVRSSIDGTIATVLIHPGQRASKQEVVLNIVPNDRSVLAEIWMPSSEVGFVASGQRVNLKYQAFPFRTYGVQGGKVREVSEVALNAADVTQILGKKVDEPRYRVLVSLDAQTVEAQGGPRPLKVGMQLEGDVLLGRRRLVDWLIDPLDGRRPSHESVASVGGDRS